MSLSQVLARLGPSVYERPRMISPRRLTAFARALGKRIAALRVEAGMTQEALAERLDSAKAVVSRIERGTTVPSLNRIVEIADALGVDARELFAFDDGGRTGSEAVAERIASMVRARPVEEGERLLRVAREVLGRRK